MNIGYVFTNFNNSSFTRGVIESLEGDGSSKSNFVVIVDNKSDTEDIDELRLIEREFPHVKIIYNNENIGYFRGLNVGIKYLRNAGLTLDCIVIGNNDLVFPANFHDRMNACRERLSEYAVISPDLLTLDGVHQNPHVRRRISTSRKYIWDIYYSSYSLALLIRYIAGATRPFTARKDCHSHQEGGLIYMGYGACYILTPLFFRHFEELQAPTFLMGEEMFLTRQLMDRGLGIFYEPGILVRHHDHATISKLPDKKLWEISRESHQLLRKLNI